MDPTTINLSDKAILVHLRVCRWAGTKQDPTVTAEAFLRNVAQAAGGTQDRKHKQGIIGAARHALQHKFGMGHSH